ncbi:MAG: NUDIX hydrolase [Candidatus Binatia bacterium]
MTTRRPKHASTVLLARPDPNGKFEILLTRRPSEMKFLGGYYVFPGGSVCPEDRSEKTLGRCRGLLAKEAGKILGDHLGPELSLAHWVAVIRELFEEVGIVLCVGENGAARDVKDPDTARRFEDRRKALVAGSLDFGSFLEAENLFCDLSRLVYFSHRVTPEFYPMRFDTRFYLAVLPEGQTALQESEEVADSLWIAPDQALRRADRDLPLLPPTTTMLQNLCAYESWQSLCEKFSLT